jgi:uncharacterized protein
MKKIPKKNERIGIDKYGRNELLNQVINNDLKKVEELLKSCSDVNIQDDNGWTSLHFAFQNYSKEMVELLLGNKVNPNLQDFNGNTAMSIALFNCKGKNNGIIKLLLDYNADPYIKNNYGVSAIDLAQQVTNFDLKVFFPDIFK